MTPNRITAIRIVAAFSAVALFAFLGHVFAADVTAVALTIAAMALDGLDGYVARTRGLSTPLGAQLDILGDRIVENLFFTFFAVRGLVSIWVPVLFFVRGALTDLMRGVAARNGRTGFGHDGMIETPWARGLVASRASRASYAILKCVCFCWLGVLLSLEHAAALPLGEEVHSWLLLGGRALVASAAVFCIVRAIPVVWEGRRYLVAMEKPTASTAPQVVR